MKFQLSQGTFPDRPLPRERSEAIAKEAEAIVAHTLELSESFAGAGRELDGRAWKLLKAKEKVRIYRSRHAPRTTKAEKAVFAATKRGKEDTLTASSRSNGDASALNKYWSDWSPTSTASASSYSSGPSVHGADGEASTPSSASSHGHSKRSFMRRHVKKFLSSGSSSASSSSSNFSSTFSSMGSSRTSASSSDEAGTAVEHNNDDPRAPGERVPIIVAAGQVSGTVEDIALGWQADTLPRWLQRDAFLGNEMDSCQLLYTIQAPTPKDPFRCLSVKWGVLSLAKFTSARDYIYLEATGVTKNAKGERVCYYIRQSIELPGFRELLDLSLIRGYVSTCFTFRASDVENVEFFGRGVFDPRGDMRRSHACALYAERLMIVSDIAEYTLSQKLTWLAQQNQQNQRRNRAGDRWTTSPKCENCHKGLNKLGTLVQSGGACHCCRKVSFFYWCADMTMLCFTNI